MSFELTLTTHPLNAPHRHILTGMVTRALQAEQKRLDKEREQRLKEKEMIQKKLEQSMRVRERLLNARPADQGDSPGPISYVLTLAIYINLGPYIHMTDLCMILLLARPIKVIPLVLVLYINPSRIY